MLEYKKNSNSIFILFFFVFVVIYLFNFEEYNTTFATDFRVRYKPYGLEIINYIINFDFSENFLLFGGDTHYAFFNSYFIPELITGLLLYITPNELIFSVCSNFLNMILLFVSIKLFFDTLNLENKAEVVIIFFIFFFLYIANWVWVFWKLAEIYFLFIFSYIFCFITKGIQEKKIQYILISFILVCLSFITKPQALAVIPFFFCTVFLLYYKIFNFSKSIIFIILSYFLFFPLLVFFIMQFNFTNMLTYFYIDGKINGIILYTYEDFLKQFNLSKSKFAELIYYYFLIIKKTVYQVTFFRETYSLKHNLFLIPYSLIFYFFLILNLDYLYKKYNLFFKLTILITIFSILLNSSLGMSGEPNRTVLFNLIPLYILFSISFREWIKKIY